MSHPISATVDVLTAEVRVLMVGSRQVTVSVFKQLDHVHERYVEIMGRVAFESPLPANRKWERRHGYAADREVWVVGKDVRSGALVRARRVAGGGVEWGHPAYVAVREWDQLPLIVLAGLR